MLMLAQPPVRRKALLSAQIIIYGNAVRLVQAEQNTQFALSCVEMEIWTLQITSLVIVWTDLTCLKLLNLDHVTTQ